MCEAIPRSAAASSDSVSGSADGRSSAEWRTASTSCAGRRLQLAAPLAPRLVDRDEHLAEARQPVPRLGRVVRAAVERLPAGVRKTVIGQPPLPVIACTASM